MAYEKPELTMSEIEKYCGIILDRERLRLHRCLAAI